MVFYGQAIIILIVTILWMVLVSNSPRSHRFITEREVEYIENSLGAAVSKEKKVPPYGKIFLSIPFIALTILHYGNLWGLLFLLTISPEYLKTQLEFDMKRSGLYSSLPHLARFLMGFVFGWIGDFLRHRTNTTVIRKSFCIFCKLKMFFYCEFRIKISVEHNVFLTFTFVNFMKCCSACHPWSPTSFHSIHRRQNTNYNHFNRLARIQRCCYSD